MSEATWYVYSSIPFDRSPTPLSPRLSCAACLGRGDWPNGRHDLPRVRPVVPDPNQARPVHGSFAFYLHRGVKGIE